MRIHSFSAISAIVAGCIISILAANALACGESLFRVGKGVSFRQYTAPLPGSILVVASTDAELAMAEHLAAAGHDVHVVSGPDRISDELIKHDFDIVLAYFSQRDEVLAQTAAAAVTYLPVAMEGSDEESEARRLHEQSLSSDDSLKTFLKTIHRTLKAHG